MRLEQMVHDVIELPEQQLVLLHIPQQSIQVFHSEVFSLAAIQQDFLNDHKAILLQIVTGPL